MARITVRGLPLLPLLVVSLAAACPWPAIADDATPTIRIVEPADGAVVKGPGVTVRVDVSNFTLQRRGSGKRPNAGHIHYWIDDRTDAMTYPATTETNVKLLLPPGRHKIRAELVLDDHTSLAEGHRDEELHTMPADAAFEHRSSMSTVIVHVQ
jgi:hypothetical protein